MYTSRRQDHWGSAAQQDGGVAGAGSWKEYGLMSGLRKEIATVTTMTKR